MDVQAKPHTNKYKVITNDWNYDSDCTLTSLPVPDFENFKSLITVFQSVPVSLTPEMLEVVTQGTGKEITGKLLSVEVHNLFP
jgi:hypothetical protein